MGRNAAIKRFDPRNGKTGDLFGSRDGRLPVVLELLRSPWVERASRLSAIAEQAGGKRVEREVEVAWDGDRRRPSRFEMSGTRYGVDAVVQTWTVERWWWDERRHVSRRCFRVMARGGIYDLAYDRLAGRWLLVGILD